MVCKGKRLLQSETLIDYCRKKLEYYAIYILFCPVFKDLRNEDNYCGGR